MIRKFNNFKFVMGVIISILFVFGYIVSVLNYGVDSEVSFRIIALAVCLIMLTPKSELSIIKRAYGYKCKWFNDSDIEVLETGKISKNTAYAIGKEKTESFPTGSKYILIFADDSRKKDMLIKEYNKTFTDSNLAEVSEYLDNFSDYWVFSNSIRSMIKEIRNRKQSS